MPDRQLKRAQDTEGILGKGIGDASHTRDGNQARARDRVDELACFGMRHIVAQPGAAPGRVQRHDVRAIPW